MVTFECMRGHGELLRFNTMWQVQSLSAKVRTAIGEDEDLVAVETTGYWQCQVPKLLVII